MSGPSPRSRSRTRWLFWGLSGASTALSALAMIPPLALPEAISATPTLLDLLQQRFPSPPAPSAGADAPDAILVPGGGVDNYVVATTHGGAPSGAGERVTAALALSQKYPSAKLVLSGTGEADPVPLLVRAGIDHSRIISETSSRNTFENAAFAARILVPDRRRCYILVTSAMHMPRAIGAYRAAGFEVDAYPVDFRHMDEPNLARFIWKEVIGLIGYRLTLRTTAFFPAPEPAAAACGFR